MATVLIEPGLTSTSSQAIEVTDSGGALISLYTQDGEPVPYGVVFYLERLSVAENYQPVKTIEYGQITLKHDVNALLITAPGTYRVVRPDISSFGVPVGVQLG